MIIKEGLDSSDLAGFLRPWKDFGKILKGEERKIFETKRIKLDVLKSEKIIGLN